MAKKKSKSNYHRGYLLKRILEVQEIALEKKALGIPYTRIYEDYVEEQYHISLSTFKRWMGVNAKRELRKLEEEQAEEKREKERQMVLFNESETNDDTLQTETDQGGQEPSDKLR